MTQHNPQLRYMIGQMLLCGFDGSNLHDQDDIAIAISQHGLGGVILFDKDLRNRLPTKNIINPAQVKQLNQQLQHYAQLGSYRYHFPALPLFIAVDYEGGVVNRLKTDYGFPQTVSAAEFARLDHQHAVEIAATMANTLADAGFNMNFAPLIDLAVNPENPIIAKLSRSFGSDPQVVIDAAYIVATELQRRNIIFTYKHFPGHGSSTADSHLGFVDISQTWQREELLPYVELLNRPISCHAIMIGHVINKMLDPSGLPATLSYEIQTLLLREQLNYQGLIIVDDLQMQAIADHFGVEEAVVKSINAGADILIFGNQLSKQPQNVPELIDMIYNNVNAGTIDIKKIEQAFKRITEVKQRHG